MGRNVEVTNLSSGPRGWVEVGKSKPTVLARGQTELLTVSDHVFGLMKYEAELTPPGLELSDLGAVQMDHDGDKRMGGAAQATATKPKPAPAPTTPEPSADGYVESLPFDTLEDDQLRSFLAAAEVTFHPNTGRAKLLIRAREVDRAAFASAAASPEEAV